MDALPDGQIPISNFNKKFWWYKMKYQNREEEEEKTVSRSKSVND